LGKQYTRPSHEPKSRAETKFDKIYINIVDGNAILPFIIAEIIEDSEFDYKNASQSSVRGARYFIFIIDDYFRYR
jgi:hypothetical protein